MATQLRNDNSLRFFHIPWTKRTAGWRETTGANEISLPRVETVFFRQKVPANPPSWRINATRGSCFSNSFLFFFFFARRWENILGAFEREIGIGNWERMLIIEYWPLAKISCNCYKIIQEMPVQSTNLFISSSTKIECSFYYLLSKYQKMLFHLYSTHRKDTQRKVTWDSQKLDDIIFYRVLLKFDTIVIRNMLNSN